MYPTKLTVESLHVETFQPSDEGFEIDLLSDTYVTTGGPYLCAADCGSDRCSRSVDTC
jgi:hypothetical protein